MNGKSQQVAAKVAVGLAIVVVLGLAGMANDGMGSGALGTLPPLPGLDASDLQQSADLAFGIGVAPVVAPQVTLDTVGLHTVTLNGRMSLTISGINAYGYTRVQWAELYPDGQWRIFDLSGYYPSGRLPATFIGDTVGRHTVLIWVDNNANGLVDRYEVTNPWLTVDVTNRKTVFRIILHF